MDVALPHINESVTALSADGRPVLEVHQHLNSSTGITIAMGFTEGLEPRDAG